MEVAAGMDVVALRREFGRGLRMAGGFDKRILAAGKAAIRKELARLRPVIEEGGYIPAIDHGTPPDVSFANVREYVGGLKALYGMTGWKKTSHPHRRCRHCRAARRWWGAFPGMAAENGLRHQAPHGHEA